MARRLPERVFDPSKPLVAVKSFIANGRHYGNGDRFNWKQNSVAQRRVRQMYDARYVVHEEELKTPAPVATEETKTTLKKPSAPKVAKKTKEKGE